MDGVDDVESIGPSSININLRCRRNIRVLGEDKV